MVHDAGAAGVGEELRPVAEEPAGRDPEGEPHHPLPRILHLGQLAPARPQLLHDDAHVLLGHVDHQLLVRLEPLAVRPQLGDDPRPRHLELVPLAPHRLHQDAEVELAPAGDGVGIGAVGLLHPERHVPLQLAEQPVPELPAGDVLPVPSGERAVVHDEVDRDRRLLDRDAGEPLGARPPP